MQAKSFLASVALVLCAGALGLWMIAPHSQDSLSRAQNGHVLRVGYALEAPFVVQERDGRVSGESPEVLRASLHRLGISRIEWVHVDFGNLIHELESGRIDVIAAGLFITPARSQRVLFSLPSAAVRPGLVWRADLGAKATTIDLAGFAKFPSGKLAVIAGAVEGDLALKVGIPSARVTPYPDATSAWAAVQRQRADGFALSTVSLRYLMRYEGAEALLLNEDINPGAAPGLPAFAFRLQDVALRDAINRVLRTYLGSNAHLALVEGFGFARADIPVQAAAAEGL